MNNLNVMGKARKAKINNVVILQTFQLNQHMIIIFSSVDYNIWVMVK